MKSLHHVSRGSARARTVLRAGTALPLLLAAWPVAAEPIAEQASGDISIEAESATGTPIAVELSSSAGSVTASVTTVSATAQAGDRDYVVGLETLTDGSISGTFESIAGTGEGELLGLGAVTLDGNIALDVGTVDVDGAATAGIAARTTNGDVQIAADAVIARGTGQDSQFEFYEAVFGGSDTGSVTIDVGTAETHGTYGSAIVALAGDVASITAESATAHYENTVAVYALGANGASVDVGTITETAEDGQGAYVGSANGNASLTAGTISVGDFAQGARVNAAAGDVNIEVGTVTGGTGLFVDPTAGDVSISAGVVDAHSYAINAATNSGGNLTIAAGTVSSTNDDTATIIADAIGGGAIAIDVDDASGAGVDRATIYANTDTGSIAITGGNVSGSGDAGLGVYAHSTNGDVSVALDNVATTGVGSVNNHFSEGVLAESINGTASVTVGSASVEGFGASAVAALGGAGATVSVEDASVAGQQSAAVYASSSNGAALVDAGTVTLRGDSQAAIQAFGNGGASTVSVDSIDGQGSLGAGVYAAGTAGASVTSGTIDVERYGVRAVGLDDSNVAITTSGNTISEAAYALSGQGGDVSITTGEGTLTQGFSHGIRAAATDSATIVNGGTASATGDLGTAIQVTAPGVVSIVSNAVSVTGAGADPGVRDDGSGYRFEQGGIVVEGGDGAIAIDAGAVDVEGEFRYGITARGNGAIAITADEVNHASADSVAVVARGGSGDVSIATGTVTTTGASGAGIFGNTMSGNITIAAGTTRVESEGLQGNFTGDAVTAISGSGAVSVTSEDAFSAALYGSAVVGLSGGSVSIVSANAETTGDGGVAVYGESYGHNLSLDAESVATAGDSSGAVTGRARNGTADVRVGDVTATGEGAQGVGAFGLIANLTVDGTVSATARAVLASGTAETHVLINGGATSTDAAGVISISNHGVVEIAQGASVSGGTAGVTLLGSPQGGFTEFYNSGTVTGVNGAAVFGGKQDPNAPDASFYIQNNGTLVGETGVAVLTGAGDDTLELTNLSVVDGIADLGDGDDRLVLDLNDDAPDGALGQLASTVNVEGLSVDSGAWRANGAQSVYDFVEIEEGATLTVVENEEGSLAVETGLVELDGVLRLDLSVDETEGDLGEITIVGGGSLHLVGTARVELTDATGLQHTNGTFVENGELLLTTVYGGDISTSGDGVFELGDGGDFTGDLVNNGTFVFSRAGDYDFLGDFSGSGLLEKQGDGTLTFAGLYAFEGTTSVLGGSVAFTGQLSEDTELDLEGGTVDLSQVEGGEQTIAELSGEGGTVQLGETQLIIEQFGDTVFSGTITGMGELLKDGDGELDLTGDGTGFTGTGQVDGGTLSVNGDYSNAGFLVNEGGTLGGAGTIGETQVSGGTLAPGNSIDTLTVNGDVTFTGASVFEVEVDAAGNSDLVQATGTATLGGASVDVIAESGTYRPLTDYTILTAAGGVSGTFGSVETNLAFLDPSLAYSDTAVTLRLVRNDVDFSALGETANQAAIGNLIEGLGFGDTLYDETLTLVDSDVAVSFASLTGEVYPAYGAALIESAEMLRRQSAESMAGEGTYAWATGLYNDVDSGNGAGGIGLIGRGVAGGFGFGGNGFSVSAGLGKLDHDDGGADFADGDVTFAIGQLAYDGPAGLSASAGAQFGWADGETRRQTALGTVGGAVSGAIEGDYLQLFGEVAYGLPMGGMTVEPFAGVSRVSLELDGVTETGAPTALAVAPIDRDVTFGDVGVRFSGDTGSGIRPFASAAYRRAWGDRASVAAVGFAGSPGTALIGAAPIAKSAAELAAGLAVTRGPVEIEVGYEGTISNAFDSHGLNAAVKFRF